MKIKELKENQPLNVIEVYKHEGIPSFGLDNKSNDSTLEFKQIHTMVFTDGEFLKESEEKIKNIKEYYIGNKKYEYRVDTLKTRDIFLKNYSYAIVYLVAQEWITVGNVRRWFARDD